MMTTTLKATPAQKSFVRSLRGPHETLAAIETGHAAVAAAGNNEKEVVAAIFMTHRVIAEIEGAEVAMQIIDNVFRVDPTATCDLKNAA